ncbi:MAG: triose-phosphate isomerase [Bacteroidia bacterium]|nr:triose-phosphate isomerase [Bacteroidia bacterium]
MRRKIVAGNWKMNKTLNEATVFFNDLSSYKLPENVTTLVIPPYTHLFLNFPSNINKGAQNVSLHNNGAYTGEISAQIIKSFNVNYCLVGHSERRKYFGENNAQLSEKINRLLEQEITPIFCIGETLEEREKNIHFDLLKQQLESVFNLTALQFEKIIIAYEPVWAIGTGKNATKEQAEEIHLFIRTEIEKKFGENISKKTSILYGGSCNAKNAPELFSMPNIDGGLIGGASLIAKDFFEIISAASK